MMRAIALTIMCLAWLPARADGLSDLKAALSRADTGTALRAAIETRTWRRHGEEKESAAEAGRASVLAEDGPRGLAIVHAREVTARIDGELRARARDPNSKTPTLTALEELGVRDVMALASAAPVLQRLIERARFKAEKAAVHQGRPARLLTFEMPITALSARERKYAKQFSAVFDVWIGADGVPLASRLHQTMSGRAFVVVSFESSYQEETVYGLAGPRLLALRKETRTSTTGAGEGEERRVLTTVQLQGGAN